MVDDGWREKFRAWRARASGKQGERMAETVLKNLGFKIVARNWRSPRDQRDEIDLVCLDGDALVFVEVKTRATDALVSGYYTVDRRKKAALRRAIDAYLKSLRPENRPQTFRFDVVEVRAGFDPHVEATVHHFANVPLFEKHDGF